MKIQPTKKFPSIACCGIDCGLCPTYYTQGPSNCPGCGGPDFYNKHPSCSILTCCITKNGYETCTDCEDFPCERIKSWDIADSFVTHKVCLQNLNEIKQNGMEKFVKQQEERIKILKFLLSSYNDGRSKSFFCIATALLPITTLTSILEVAKKKIHKEDIDPRDTKSKAKLLREIFNDHARNEGIELKLMKGVK